MPRFQYTIAPFLAVKMPTGDDGHGWCIVAMTKLY